MRAWQPTGAQHPARRDCSEPSTRPCSSCDATAPDCHGWRRDVPWIAHACATSGVTRSQQAEHVPVPLVRGDRPAATAGGGMRAERHTCVPHPAGHDRREPSTRPCRSCDATAPACHGLRRDVRRVARVCAASGNSRSPRAAQHVPVPLARRNPLPPATAGSEDVRCTAHVCATSGASRSPRAERVPMQLVQRDPPRLSRPAAGCAPGGQRVCRILRLAIAASRARPRATRATRPPPPATAGGRAVRRAAHVCAASHGSRL